MNVDGLMSDVYVVLMTSEYAFLWSGSTSLLSTAQLHLPVTVSAVLFTMSSYVVQFTQTYSVFT